MHEGSDSYRFPDFQNASSFHLFFFDGTQLLRLQNAHNHLVA